MHKFAAFSLFASLVATSFVIGAYAGNPPPMTENLEWKGHVIVEFRDELGAINPVMDGGVALLGEASLDALARQFNVYNVRQLIPGAQKPTNPRLHDMSRFYVAEFPIEIDLHEVMAAYGQNPAIISATPDYIRKMDYIPNDPLYNSEWHLGRVNAPLAYQYCAGSNTVIAGVVDSGIDTAHADLRDNVWVNPGEDLNGNGVIEPSEWNGIDDDHNGYIDDFWGWNVWQGNNNVQDTSVPSGGGHGTHTSGCVSAVTDNAIGVASLAQHTKVIMARAGDGQYIYASTAGINYLANNGAKVISMSYGGTFYSVAEQAAINNAWALGAAVFASAGNTYDSTYHYPGAYENVVAVAATDQSDHKADFSTYGSWVDVSAPGVSIWGPVPGGGYMAWDGTSFSCPITASLACLIMAAKPTYSNADVVAQILATAVNIDNLNPQYAGLLGTGRIDAGAAISTLFCNLQLDNIVFDDASGNGDGRPDPGETVNMLWVLTNTNLAVGANQVEVDLTCTDPDITILQGTNNFASIPGGGSVNNNSAPMSFSVDSTAAIHEVTLVLTVTEPTLRFPVVVQYQQMIGRPDVIVIDDDGGANYQQFYDNDLDSLAIQHDIWNENANGVISQDELMLYPTVIWHTSNTDDPLDSTEQACIQYYLSNHGQLFLTGEDIDEQFAGTGFYANVLHCSSADTLGGVTLTGVTGDPISNGTNLMLFGGSGGAGNNQSPSTIAPGSGASLVYVYGSGLGGGMRWNGVGGELVYFSFCFEAVSGFGTSTKRRDVLSNILDWFEQTAVLSASEQPLPGSYFLSQNYPNPFNPETEIGFALPRKAHVQLTVYDLSGRTVEKLLNGNLSAGEHRVHFSAANLASGIYLYRLVTDGATLTRKMILLK